ncbi:uncharacterized protein L199_001433 [Kwoniella botswanensis]|uniref:uncharacterized protein n=1 Tax=Kwoniella botswanensis TaxID=1268659 RepID=UPI00315D9F6E
MDSQIPIQDYPFDGRYHGLSTSPVISRDWPLTELTANELPDLTANAGSAPNTQHFDLNGMSQNNVSNGDKKAISTKQGVGMVYYHNRQHLSSKYQNRGQPSRNPYLTRAIVGDNHTSSHNSHPHSTRCSTALEVKPRLNELKSDECLNPYAESDSREGIIETNPIASPHDAEEESPVHQVTVDRPVDTSYLHSESDSEDAQEQSPERRSISPQSRWSVDWHSLHQLEKDGDDLQWHLEKSRSKLEKSQRKEQISAENLEDVLRQLGFSQVTTEYLTHHNNWLFHENASLHNRCALGENYVNNPRGQLRDDTEMFGLAATELSELRRTNDALREMIESLVSRIQMNTE